MVFLLAFKVFFWKQMYQEALYKIKSIWFGMFLDTILFEKNFKMFVSPCLQTFFLSSQSEFVISVTRYLRFI